MPFSLLEALLLLSSPGSPTDSYTDLSVDKQLLLTISPSLPFGAELLVDLANGMLLCPSVMRPPMHPHRGLGTAIPSL